MTPELIGSHIRIAWQTVLKGSLKQQSALGICAIRKIAGKSSPVLQLSLIKLDELPCSFLHQLRVSRDGSNNTKRH